MDRPIADNINQVAEGPACVFGGNVQGAIVSSKPPHMVSNTDRH